MNLPAYKFANASLEQIAASTTLEREQLVRDAPSLAAEMIQHLARAAISGTLRCAYCQAVRTEPKTHAEACQRLVVLMKDLLANTAPTR
jgi:alkylhydroperoxidase family enzyme